MNQSIKKKRKISSPLNEWTPERIRMLAEIVMSRIRNHQSVAFTSTGRALSLRNYTHLGMAFQYAGVCKMSDGQNQYWTLLNDDISDEVIKKIIEFPKVYKQRLAEKKNVDDVQLPLKVDVVKSAPQKEKEEISYQQRVSAFQCPHCGFMLTVTNYDPNK